MTQPITVGLAAVLLAAIVAGITYVIATRQIARRVDAHREQGLLLATQTGELEAHAADLGAQALELEMQSAELQEQARALEAKNEELAAALAEAQAARAEAEMLEREQRALIHAMRDVVLVLDADGRYVKIPPTAPDLLYRVSDDLLGKRMHDVMQREAADAFLAIVRRAIDSNDAVPVEYDLPIGAELVHFAGVATPMGDGRVLWVARDVTSRWKMEEALRASERQYRLLFDSNPLPMWVYDRATLRFLAVNAAAERQYGFTRDEFLGMTLLDIRPLEDAERLRLAATEVPQGLHSSGRWRHRRKDGSLLDVEISAYPIDLGTGPAELVLAHDVTERLRAEAQLLETSTTLGAVISDSPSAIITLDLDRRVTRWNPAAQRLLGWRAGDVIGASYEEVIPREASELHRRAWERVLANEAVTDLDLPFRRDDGRTIELTVSMAVLQHGEAPSGLILVGQDLTRRKELEEQLHQAQKMEAVGQLAGGVAHDFNNMLTVIKSYCALMLGDLGEDDAHAGDVREIAAAADRAAAVSRQLLAFSRRQVLQPRLLDVGALVASVDRLLRRLVREDIHIACPPSAQPATVWADAGQLEQVLVNLVVNARDAMPDGGRLTIATGRAFHLLPAASADAPQDCVVIEVSDTGSGMTPDVQARIFEPFFTTKDAATGTGLGLSTAYGIIRQSGGDITVESTPGAGTTFRIHLPYHPGVPASPARGASNEPSPSAGETLLIVEDDEALRAVACRILRRHGYTVIVARNGREALEIHAHHPSRIDLVVSDVVMPEMSGPELMQRIREKDANMRMLLMSGYSSDTIVLPAAATVGTAALDKPFTPAELLSRVREVLDVAVGEETVPG